MKDQSGIKKLLKQFKSAQLRKANLDTGRARRALIKNAIENGTDGWTEQLKRIVTDERGNLLPINGYDDEQSNS